MSVSSLPMRQLLGPLDRLGARLAFHELERLDDAQLVLALPDGTQRSFGRAALEGPLAPVVTVHDLAVFRRLLLRGELGLGEAYEESMWDCPELVGLLSLGARQRAKLGFDSGSLAFAARLRARLAHRAHKPRNAHLSRRNVAAHYDHGNEFYRLWLDESMTYSCAVFASVNQSLEEAQRNKHRLMAEKAGLKAGDNVLDIGCGWGAFARYAASEYGCQVTGITLSNEQLREAVARTAATGLAGRVTIKLADYRRLTGNFDTIVSIGMFEHVGADYWETFFRRCHALLPPDGRLVLQTISLPDSALGGTSAARGGSNVISFPAPVFPHLRRSSAVLAERDSPWCMSRTSEATTPLRCTTGAPAFIKVVMPFARLVTAPGSSAAGTTTSPSPKLALQPGQCPISRSCSNAVSLPADVGAEADFAPGGRAPPCR